MTYILPHSLSLVVAVVNAEDYTKMYFQQLHFCLHTYTSTAKKMKQVLGLTGVWLDDGEWMVVYVSEFWNKRESAKEKIGAFKRISS